MNITEKINKLETDFDKETYERTLSELRGIADRVALCQSRLRDKRGHLDLRNIDVTEEVVYRQVEIEEEFLNKATDLATPYWIDTRLSLCQNWVSNNLDHIASLHKHWQDKNTVCNIP